MLSSTFSNHSHTILPIHFHVHTFLSSCSSPSAFHYIPCFSGKAKAYAMGVLELHCDHWLTTMLRLFVHGQPPIRMFNGLTREAMVRAHSWTRQSVEIQMIFESSTAFILLILAHLLQKIEGWRGKRRQQMRQTASSHKCPFLHTVAGTQIFTCKSQSSIPIQSKFQKWLPLTTVELRAFSTAHKPSIASTSLTEGHDKRRGGQNTTQSKTRV